MYSMIWKLKNNKEVEHFDNITMEKVIELLEQKKEQIDTVVIGRVD